MGALDWFVVHDDEGLQALEDGWRRLATLSPDPSLFATYEWNAVWWSCFGRGRRLHVVGARRDGELVALAPLCTKRGVGGVRGREFLGSEDAAQARRRVAAGEEALGPELAGVAIQDPGWDLLDLWCVPLGTLSASSWNASLSARRGPHRVTRLSTNPVLDLS